MSLPCDFARCPGYEDSPPCLSCARNVIFDDNSRCLQVPFIRPDKPARTGCPHSLTKD